MKLKIPIVPRCMYDELLRTSQSQRQESRRQLNLSLRAHARDIDRIRSLTLQLEEKNRQLHESGHQQPHPVLVSITKGD